MVFSDFNFMFVFMYYYFKSMKLFHLKKKFNYFFKQQIIFLKIVPKFIKAFFWKTFEKALSKIKKLLTTFQNKHF